MPSTVCCMYSGTPLIWTPMGQRGLLIEMHARVVFGVVKGVLFREVSLVQRCPYRGVLEVEYTHNTYTHQWSCCDPSSCCYPPSLLPSLPSLPPLCPQCPPPQTVAQHPAARHGVDGPPCLLLQHRKRNRHNYYIVCV